MPLIRFPTPTGLVYTIDLTKIADRENPRTVEAPIFGNTANTPFTVDWGDGTSTNFAAGANTFPTHEYAQGAGDVFTVVIRSANGNLPRIGYIPGQAASNANNLTYAVTSVDHFGGQTGGGTTLTYNYVLFSAANVTYCDPRLAGQQNLNDLYKFFQNSGLNQPIESFCFDFAVLCSQYTFATAFSNTKVYGVITSGLFRHCALAEQFSSAFINCTGLTAIAADAFDNCASITYLSQTFYGCSGIHGAPYIFWKADGSLDTDRFPNLTNGNNCYSGCSAALRAQVPTEYGGTMTVS